VCADVGALTSHIASSFAELCQQAGLELRLDCRPATADVDPGMWETILLNLLSNAVKYTLTGSITVTVRSEASFCRVMIRDTGVGIAEADLKRLGERFFRAEDVHGRSVEGTGIGLTAHSGAVPPSRFACRDRSRARPPNFRPPACRTIRMSSRPTSGQRRDRRRRVMRRPHLTAASWC
jgi:Histidine kinase-, DNA gyrase B-, and HSP90-like ATPase